MKKLSIILMALLVVGTFGGAAQSQSMAIDPSMVNVSPGETTTFDVVISGLTNGLERINVDLEIGSNCAADITGVIGGNLSGFTYLTTTSDISSDGKSVTLSAFTMSEYTGTGGIVYTLEVTGKSSGDTSCPINIIKNSINDKDGNDITASVTVQDGDLNVTQHEVSIEIDRSSWNLVSVPVKPENSDPTAVFSGMNNPNEIYHWEPELNNGKGGFLTPDKGFNEVNVLEGCWLLLEESEVPKTFLIKGVHKESREITLQEPGWHQIGVPNNYAWANIGVKQGNSQTMTVAEQADGPSAPHWMSRFLWKYSSAAESTYTAYDADTNSFAMEQGDGYWIRTREDNVTLVIPYDSSNSATSKHTQAEGIPMNSEKAKKLNIPAPPSPPNQVAESNELLPVQAAPNPVTGDQLTFSIPETEPNVKKVKLEVFSTSGEQRYQSSYLDSRTITWDLTTSDGNKLANGIYLYQIQAKGVTGETKTSAVKKLLVLQ